MSKKGKVRMTWPARVKATPERFILGQPIVSSNADPKGSIKRQYVPDGKPDRRKEG